MLVWIGPGVLKSAYGTVYPGDRLNENRHDSRQIQQWIAEGNVERR